MTMLLRACALVGALALALTGCQHSPASRTEQASAPAPEPQAVAAPQEQGPSRAYHAARNVPSSGLALEGYCPVAYFAVNEPLRGKPEHRSEYGGVTYQFVSAEAKAAFDAEPERYVPAYGGWCAFGMSIGDKFPVDPRSFKIVEGRLLLFLKNEAVDARALWEQGEEADLLQKAAATWAKVQG